ncbi:MAG TPA: amino acid permease [Candidatus Methylacidiphilales bacterium]|nr:amino acid permease [Candidatus Methylacidiphilales bacterium]
MKKGSTPQLVSTWPAAALVVSNMIGIGVFTSLGFQIAGFSRDGVSDLSSSVFPLIMLWVVGGVLALCGALCYAELATALPRSGGEYNFLSRIYHPAVGFCTGLCSATIGFAAPIAVSALVFGSYLCRAFPGIAHVVPNNTEHVAAFLLVTLITAAHLRSVRFTGFFQAATSAATVLLILTFVAFGFTSTPAQAVTFLPHKTDWALLVSGPFFSSLLWVMYSYSGWNAASYIVEEVRNPAKALPRALILGTAFVMLLYVAVNGVFLYTTSLGALSGKLEVAHVAGTQIFGEGGARVVSGLICVGLVANVSGMMWVGSRVTEAIGATYPALGLLGRTSGTRVPYVSLIYQYAVVFVLLFFKPDNIVNYVGSIILFWSLLAVVGVIVLRIREPNLPRPYRTWGYPVTPIIFAIITICCLVQNSQIHLRETLIGGATVLIGIPIYMWISRNVPEEQLRGKSVPESST